MMAPLTTAIDRNTNINSIGNSGVSSTTQAPATKLRSRHIRRRVRGGVPWRYGARRARGSKTARWCHQDGQECLRREDSGENRIGSCRSEKRHEHKRRHRRKYRWNCCRDHDGADRSANTHRTVEATRRGGVCNLRGGSRRCRLRRDGNCHETRELAVEKAGKRAGHRRQQSCGDFAAGERREHQKTVAHGEQYSLQPWRRPSTHRRCG